MYRLMTVRTGLRTKHVPSVEQENLAADVVYTAHEQSRLPLIESPYQSKELHVGTCQSKELHSGACQSEERHSRNDHKREWH